MVSLAFYSCKEDEEISESIEFLNEEIVPPTETTCGSSLTRDINTSGGVKVGEVVLANDIDSLYVTVNTDEEWYFSAAYLYIGEIRNIPVNDDLNVRVNEFPIKTSHEPLVRSVQFTFSLNEIAACEDIALSLETKRLNSSGNVLEEARSWMDGSALDGVAVDGSYYEYCLNECVVKYPIENVATMAFEDLYPEAGDADYNDFVTTMKANVYYKGKVPNKVEMEFSALARGSAFDHEFRIGFPISGNVNVEIKRYSPLNDAVPYETEQLTNVGGEDFFITVFPSTREILEPQGNRFHANSNPGTTFVEPSKSVITIDILEGEMLLPIPFDPYIIVKGPDVEIHIAELTQKIDADGDNMKDYWEIGEAIYPFGIVMFSEWAWPLELENILSVYPKFEYVFVDGIFRPRDPGWYLTPKEDSKYFKRELFN